MIISFLNQKGGVGKTTLALNVAGRLALLSKSILYIDADRQGTALDWSEARDGPPLFPVLGLPRPTLHRDLDSHLRNYEYVVVDGPPRIDDMARSAISASDFVVVPVQPSPMDVWASREIVRLLGEASAYKELGTAFVVNRRVPNTVISREVRRALSDHPIEVASTVVSQRVAFAESVAMGKVVFEWPGGEPAAREIKRLVKELLGV